MGTGELSSTPHHRAIVSSLNVPAGEGRDGKGSGLTALTSTIQLSGLLHFSLDCPILLIQHDFLFISHITQILTVSTFQSTLPQEEWPS